MATPTNSKALDEILKTNTNKLTVVLHIVSVFVCQTILATIIEHETKYVFFGGRRMQFRSAYDIGEEKSIAQSLKEYHAIARKMRTY